MRDGAAQVAVEVDAVDESSQSSAAGRQSAHRRIGVAGSLPLRARAHPHRGRREASHRIERLVGAGERSYTPT